jgi:plasmid replication initiation protein
MIVIVKKTAVKQQLAEASGSSRPRAQRADSWYVKSIEFTLYVSKRPASEYQRRLQPADARRRVQTEDCVTILRGQLYMTAHLLYTSTSTTAQNWEEL